MAEISDDNLSPAMRTAIAAGREILGDRAYPVALILGGQPLDTAAEVMRGIARGVERAGYDAVLIERTGIGVTWAVRRG